LLCDLNDLTDKVRIMRQLPVDRFKDAQRLCLATHSKWEADLAGEFAPINVDLDPIYIGDGNTYTTSGLDLALVLVVEDLGSWFALGWRQLVLYLRRRARRGFADNRKLRDALG
jgi:transcriptional regulator GlxA family with amidase domain